MATRIPFSDLISRLLLLFTTILLLLMHPLYAQELSLNDGNVISANGKQTITMSNNGQSLQIEHEGKVSIGPDDKSISSISEGGYLNIRKKTFGNLRELRIERMGNRLQYTYKEGGKLVPFTPEGKAWLADILPELVHSTRIGAESRVDRMYKQGGSRAVLADLAKMNSDYTKAGYISLLLQKNPPRQDKALIIKTVGSDIDSDFHKAEIFKNNKESLLSNPKDMALFLQAVKTIESDFHKANLVKLILDNQLSEANTTQALELLATINSDFHKKEVLTGLLKEPLNSRQVDLVSNRILPNFSSDFHKTEVLKALIRHQEDLSEDNINNILESIVAMKSDFHSAEALKYLLNKQQLSAANYATLFNALSKMQSDFHLAGIMKELMKAGNLNDYLDPMLKAVSRMDSDFHQAEILEELLRKAKLNKQQLISVAQTATSMKSDFHKANVLKSVCQESKDEDVKQAVAEAAKSVKSNFHLGEIHGCLNR